MQKVISSIRRKLILSILLIALAALGLFVFAACSDEITEETYKELGYTVAVNYDFQGGTVNNKDSVRILVKEYSVLPEPKVGSGGVRVPSKSGYSFKGFYLAETDADGNVVYDKDGNISVTDTEWNFKTDTVTNRDITLCAKWWENYKVVLHYGDDYALKTEVDISRNADGTPEKKLYEASLMVQDYTFLSYNLVKDSNDEATEVKFLQGAGYDLSAVVPEDDGVEIDIWGEALSGNYVLVRTANDLNSASLGEQTNYYLLDDIDLEDKEYNNDSSATANKLPKSYGGKFVGNGHTISNITINLKALDRSYDSFGLFRSIGDSAEITDVTFKNVKLSCDLSDASINRYYLGMLAGQCSAGAVVKNVNITSSEQSNTLEYLIGVGVDKTKLDIADDLLISQKPDSVKLQDCSVANVKRITSVGVVTEDKAFMLYVKYAEGQDPIVLGDGDLYKFAEKTASGYSSRTATKTEFVGDNKYVLTRADRSVYDVTFTVKNGELSATMIKRK